VLRLYQDRSDQEVKVDLRKWQGVKTIEFGHYVTDADLGKFDCPESVEEVVFRHAGFSAAGMKAVAQWRSLRTLRFIFGEVSEDMLAALVDLRGLETLELFNAHTLLTEAHVAQISHLRGLRSLSLNMLSTEEAAAFTTLRAMVKLRELSLGLSGGVSDATLEAVACLKGLTTLALGYDVRATAIGQLRALRRLRTLSLHSVAVTERVAVELKQLPCLQELQLHDSEVTAEGMSGLAELPGLSDLVIYGRGHPVGQHVRDLAGSASLRRLEFHCVWLDDAGMRAIGQLANLRELHFGPVQLGDERFLALRSAESLQYLNVEPLAAGDDFNDKDLKALRGHPGLRKLELFLPDITAAGLRELRSLPKLAVLRIEMGRITDEGMAALQAIKTLRELDLERARITDAGVARLRHFPALRVLSLANARTLTDVGAKELAPLSALEELDLSGTDLTDAGLRELEALRGLRVLRLKEMQHVTADGVRKLRAALPNTRIATSARSMKD